MAACRTIKGVVYDLKATDRKAPCARRASSPKPKPAAVAKPKPSVRPPAPAAPSSPKPKPWRAPIRVNDHRVLERQAAEREHARRESLEAAKPAKTTLAAVGRLPAAGPTLKASEKQVLEKVRKRNASGLLYTPDAISQPSLTRVVLELAQRGVLKEHGHRLYYAPEFAGDLERMSGATARLHGKKAAPVATVGTAQNRSVGSYALRQQREVPLPHTIDPSKAQRGQRVSVFNYAENEPSHGTLIGLPGDKAMYGSESEPSIEFVSGANEGMKRHIRWERIFDGWLDPNVNWKPWRG